MKLFHKYKGKLNDYTKKIIKKDLKIRKMLLKLFDLEEKK